MALPRMISLLSVLFSNQTCISSLSITSRRRFSMISSPPPNPLDIVTQFTSSLSSAQETQRSAAALGSPSCFTPTSIWSNDIVYTQKTTNTQYETSSAITEACKCFSVDMAKSGDEDVLNNLESHICSVFSPTREEVILKWNVTFVPPSSVWLSKVGGVETEFVSYNDKSGTRSTFSWNAVGRLFWDALVTGTLRVPLACIEGRSVLRFRRKPSAAAAEPPSLDSTPPPAWELTSISEELIYATELQRGSLQNRKCALDLQLFLESGRKPPHVSIESWEKEVEDCLPWMTVPGMNSLEIEPMDEEEGSMPAIIFLTVAFAMVGALAIVLAPELLGQPLFGPPNYIGDPPMSLVEFDTTYGMF